MDMIFIAAKPYEGHPYFQRTTTIEIMSDEDYPTKEADAKRIVSCINALEGVSNPAAVKQVIESAKELREVVAACFRVIDRNGLEATDDLGRELKSLGIQDGFGLRVQERIAALDTPVPKTQD